MHVFQKVPNLEKKNTIFLIKSKPHTTLQLTKNIKDILCQIKAAYLKTD